MANEFTIVAVYDDREDAQHARDELLRIGLDASRAIITANIRDAERRQEEDSASNKGSSGILGMLKNIFMPDMDRISYAEAIRRGGSLLTVRVMEQDIEHVSNILHRFNPVDIDERGRAWRETGWTGTETDAAPFTEEEAAQERARYAASIGARDKPMVRRYPV